LKERTPADVGKALERRIVVGQALYAFGAALCLVNSPAWRICRSWRPCSVARSRRTCRWRVREQTRASSWLWSQSSHRIKLTLSRCNSDVAVLYSPVSGAELWDGARPKEYDALNNLFQALTCAPIAEWTGRQSGAYLRQYRRSHGLEVADALIAGCAAANRASANARRARRVSRNRVTRN
jgi:hypothetical protein